jgi:hypothetical protein
VFVTENKSLRSVLLSLYDRELLDYLLVTALAGTGNFLIGTLEESEAPMVHIDTLSEIGIVMATEKDRVALVDGTDLFYTTALAVVTR